MQAPASFPLRYFVAYPSALLPIFTIVISLALMSGCGSSASSGQKLGGNTSVTVLLASTANDQVTRFDLQFQTLTLTSQSGKTVTLLSSSEPAEFMHLNGEIEPLTTVTIPQDIYTSATVTLGAAVFVCVAQVPDGGLGFANDSVVNQGPTVNLASPVTVTGSSMALLLSMNVSSSATFPACWSSPPFEGFSMTPTFNLSPTILSASPTNSANGKVSGLAAEVASVGTRGSSLALTVAGGPLGTRTLSAISNSATVFQGISSASSLSAGMFLTVDGAIQSDGSLLATRIEVENPSAINLFAGPIVSVNATVPVVMLYGRSELGPLLTDFVNNEPGMYDDIPRFDFSSAMFQISGQFSNLQGLPFLPSFNASNFVAGQNVEITSPTYTLAGGAGPYTPANTVTLTPQTINATVTASTLVGSFTDYTVSLASYDLFPTLAVQQGQTTLLNNPSQVEVYVDNNTQMLNTQALATGSTLRFYGLVFNDNGTLRMDCAQINDGAPITPPSTSSAQLQVGYTQTFRSEPGGHTRQATTVVIH